MNTIIDQSGKSKSTEGKLGTGVAQKNQQNQPYVKKHEGKNSIESCKCFC